MMPQNGSRRAGNAAGSSIADEFSRTETTRQPESAQASLLDAALRYAAAGFAVFPCQPRTKEPAVTRGFLAATTNPQTIRRLWRITDRNIGLRTGAASAVWILDIDGPAGEASLAALEAAHGRLPTTCTVVTSSGRHLWFVTDACPISCSASRVATAIDVRAEGGYAIVPPSVHPSGHVYRFQGTREIATAPAWLVRLTQKKTISERAIAVREGQGQGQGQGRRQGTCGAYGAVALNREISALANVRAGGRNHALNAVSFRLFQLVAGGELERDQVVQRLLSACRANGLVHDDGLPAVMATIRSGARAGLQYPRSRGKS
jgi:hypothetical protein